MMSNGKKEKLEEFRRMWRDNAIQLETSFNNGKTLVSSKYLADLCFEMEKLCIVLKSE